MDVLHEQEKSANTNCGGSDTATLKCKIEKQEDNVILPTESTKSVIKRWTTEEDLTEGLALQRKTQSLADFTRGDNFIFMYKSNRLRFVHLNSPSFSVYVAIFYIF